MVICIIGMWTAIFSRKNDQTEYEKIMSVPLPSKARGISTNRGKTVVVLEDGTVWRKTKFGWMPVK